MTKEVKPKINCLGFLSLLSLIALLGWSTGNEGLYGFFGFAYYLRYFWVLPDELFRQNLQKAATCAFLTELLALVPFMFLSFAAAILVFTIALLVLEWREQRGAEP